MFSQSLQKKTVEGLQRSLHLHPILKNKRKVIRLHLLKPHLNWISCCMYACISLSLMFRVFNKVYTGFAPPHCNGPAHLQCLCHRSGSSAARFTFTWLVITISFTLFANHHTLCESLSFQQHVFKSWLYQRLLLNFPWCSKNTVTKAISCNQCLWSHYLSKLQFM